MEIHGKERNFCMTIGAAKKIAAICPEGDIKNLDVMLTSGNTVEVVDKVAQLMVFLNEGYELKRSFEQPGYTPDVLTLEELETLEIQDLQRLQVEAIRTIRRDQKPDVELGNDPKNAEGGQISN